MSKEVSTDSLPEDTKQPKKSIDWEAVEIHYRAGLRSLKDIGKEYGVSDAGIIKRAKKDGWVRDLKAKIAAKAEAKVSAAAVSELVSAEKVANESAVVEANAQLQFNIRMQHRADIARGRKLFGDLIAEVEKITGTADLFEELALALYQPDEKGRDTLNEIYRRVISTTGRVENAGKLVAMLEKLVRLEREAFGIKSVEDEGNSSIDELINRINSEQ